MNTFNQNNQSGDNIMNFGSQPRELDSNLQTQLKEIIKTKEVVVTSVMGDGEAFNFASQIKDYLEKEGFSVNGVNQAVYSKPISGQIVEPPKDEKDSFKIIIGNKQ